MIIYYQLYDNWAHDARLRGLEEKPLEGTADIVTYGPEGNYGLWDNLVNYGILCNTPQEFSDWLVEGDLPPGYDHETLINNGDIRQFSKEN